MTLREYIDSKKKKDQTDHPIVCLLSTASGVGKTTIYNVLSGQKIARYPIAAQLSRATGGLVTPQELIKGI